MSANLNLQQDDRPPRMAKLLIDGEWIEGEGSADLHDKFTGEPIAKIAQATRTHVAQAVAGTHAAFKRGGVVPYARYEALMRAAAILEDRKQEVKDAIVAEAGFTYNDAEREVQRTGQTLRSSGEEARRLQGDMIPLQGAPNQGGRIGFTIRIPLGVVCAITPFNAPLNTTAHKVAPALAAGNAVVLKPATYTPLTSVILCEILIEAGFPKNFIALIHGPGSKIGQWLAEEEAIRFYTFTGSTEVGMRIQAGAGLRRTQMELGSIASTIVCADADLESALPKIVAAGFRKAGQMCTSIQRLYVQDAVFNRFGDMLFDAVNDLVVGNPHDAKTVVGPMIDAKEAERAQTWIDEAVAAGATVLTGGKREGPLLYPTVLTDVDKSMAVMSREIFAPVVNLVRFTDFDAALDDVNDTPYGLATGIFTNDLSKAFTASRKLEVGGVHINETSNSRVDLMPYGGCKASGFGQEGPRYAIRELTDERLVTINA